MLRFMKSARPTNATPPKVPGPTSVAAPTRYVAVQQRGLISLPADIRRRHDLDRPGAQVGIVERPDGVIELHPSLPIPADQAWFWTTRWQAMEREVDAHVAAGEVTRHATVVDLLTDLDRD